MINLGVSCLHGRPELMKSRVLELNASDERGIQVYYAYKDLFVVLMTVLSKIGDQGQSKDVCTTSCLRYNSGVS